MVVDSDMPGQGRAETFRECGKCYEGWNCPFACGIDRDTREMRGLVHVSTIRIAAALSVWILNTAAV